MDHNFIKNLIYSIPDNINNLILYAIIIGFLWLWKNVAKPAISNYRHKQADLATEKERKQAEINDKHESQITKINQTLVDSLHATLVRSWKACLRKGYKSPEDTTNFDIIYHLYKQLGGNTDGDDIKREFFLIPTRTETKIGERLGVDNPSTDQAQVIIDFYNLVKSGVVSDKDVLDVIKFVNDRRNNITKEMEETKDE